MKNWLYWLDYSVAPLLVGLVSCVYASPDFLWQVPVGFVGWTFAEYWVHRSLLHRWMYHGRHEEHHKHPELYQVVWQFPALFIAAFFLFPPGLYVGLAAGYGWFQLVHHTLHHMPLAGAPRFIQRYAEWHDVHHDRNIKANFGITTNIWDRLFGTYVA